METRKLRHAITLGRLLNFTQAARQLNMTQSALSRSIQSLEAECGLALFDRGRGTVSLTQAGREYLRHAEGLLRSEAALRNFASHASQGEGGHIALGVTPLVARVMLAPVLASRLEQPLFQAEVVIGSTKQLMRMILREAIDLAIGMGDLAAGNAAFRAVPLARLPLAMIVRRDHPLTRLETIGETDTAPYPQIRSTSYNADDSLPVLAGLMRTDPPAVTIEDYDVLDQLVARSDAIWVTSPIAARQGVAAGALVALPIPWVPEASIALAAYLPAQRTPSPLVASILDEFASVCAELPVAG